MPKEPELTDVDVYARDYPQKMKVLDMGIRRDIKKGQRALLIFSSLDKRGWVEVLGRMDGGLVGRLQEDMADGLLVGDQVFFQYRHIWDMSN